VPIATLIARLARMLPHSAMHVAPRLLDIGLTASDPNLSRLNRPGSKSLGAEPVAQRGA